MRSPPPVGVDAPVVSRAVADGWGVEPEHVEYMPVGAGGYHWRVVTAADEAYFVTVDDLDTKDWFGVDRDVVAAGLAAALDTARWLHDDVGLDFVAAPLATVDGRSTRRLSAQYALSLSPYLDGRSHPFGPHDEPVRRRRVLDELIALHSVVPPSSVPSYMAPTIGARRFLEVFLHDAHDAWDAGPLGDRARELLVPHVDALTARLEAFDRTSRAVAAASGVITHGEANGANVMTVGGRELLIDWDTVGIAVPERDLWFAVVDDADADYYASKSGHTPDVTALELYRTRWRFDDLSWVVRTLRAPHVDDDESRRSLAAVTPLVDALLEG